LALALALALALVVAVGVAWFEQEFDTLDELFVRAHSTSAAHVILAAPKPKIEYEESASIQSSGSSSKLALDSSALLSRQQSSSSDMRVASPSTPPAFEEIGEFDEDSDDIKFNTADKSSTYPRVKAATVEKLIFRLTHEKYPGILWWAWWWIPERVIESVHN
jgi:hypothetical protein